MRKMNATKYDIKGDFTSSKYLIKVFTAEHIRVKPNKNPLKTLKYVCSLKVDECNQIWIGLMRFSLFHIEPQKPSLQSPGLVVRHQRQGTIMGGRVDPVGCRLVPVGSGGPTPKGSILLETSSFMFRMVGPGHFVWGSWWELGRTRSEDL